MAKAVTILRFELERPVDGVSTVEMPSGARVISVGERDSAVCVWAECPVHRAQPYDESRRFRVVATGDEFEPTDAAWPSGADRFLGTVQVPSPVVRGGVVWHVYEVRR